MESRILERKWGVNNGVDEKQNLPTKQQHQSTINELCDRGVTSGGPAIMAGVCFLVQGCFGVSSAEH